MNLGSAPHRGATSSEDLVLQVYADDARPGQESGLDCVRRFVHADCCARFYRERGNTVHFALGILADDEAVEAAAPRQGDSPEQWIETNRGEIHARLDSLDVSCDWDCTVASSDPAAHRHLQELFLALLEQDLVYTRDAQAREGDTRWFLRSGRYAEWCDQGLEQLGGAPLAIEVQREALGKVDGVELTATLLGVGDLAVFAPSADEIGEAEFIAVSPRHPDIESIASAAMLQTLGRSQGPAPAVQTELQAAVPGVKPLLPVVVTPAHEPLALASLGIPARDESDRSIADRLTSPGGLPLKVRDSGKPRPAIRYHLTDLRISRPGAWGAPVPVVRCPNCGVMPVPSDELPVQRPTSAEGRPCPGCGGAAERDRDVLDSGFESMWMWSLLAPDEDGPLKPSQGQAQPRLIVSSAGDGSRLLHQRISGQLLHQLGESPNAPSKDPVAAAAVVGQMKIQGQDCVGAVEELDEVIAREGADVVRLALIDAAAVGTPTGLFPHSLRHAGRFLAELRDYAEPRLRARKGQPPAEIDRATRLRRRLSAWCETAADRVAEAFHRLETHRVTHNLALFLHRIKEFEEKAASDGELASEDRDAVAFALSELVALAAPCVPEVTAELRSLTAGEVVPVGGGATDREEGETR